MPYPGVDRAAVTLAVADDHGPRNEATWRIRVADGAATVTGTVAVPDAGTDVGTLSGLLVGYRPVEGARAAGDLAVHDPGAVGTLAVLVPERDPSLAESFRGRVAGGSGPGSDRGVRGFDVIAAGGGHPRTVRAVRSQVR